MKTVAIMGGGPAGSAAAERLLRGRAGLRVVVFEERLGWEKPCGGGLTPKALRRYPYLAGAAEPHTLIRDTEFVAGNGEALHLTLKKPIAVYSRSVLNRLLLSRAQALGAEVVADRVLGFERSGETWRVEARQRGYTADFLILAAGARSALRARLAPPLSPEDFVQTFGYYAPGGDTRLRVQFFNRFEGYAWAFPRPDHLSIGIAGKLGAEPTASLKRRLHSFMRAFGYDTDAALRAPVFSHLLPALSTPSWKRLTLSGPGWALAGDAAGLVDPITGEGIYFAMRSGEMLAECILTGAPEAYAKRVRREFGRKLAFGARLAHRFYLGTFLGEPSTTRMVDYARRSQAFRRLMQDLIDGSQTYPSLAARVCWTFIRSSIDLLRTSRGTLPKDPWGGASRGAQALQG